MACFREGECSKHEAVKKMEVPIWHPQTALRAHLAVFLEGRLASMQRHKNTDSCRMIDGYAVDPQVEWVRGTHTGRNQSDGLNCREGNTRSLQK